LTAPSAPEVSGERPLVRTRARSRRPGGRAPPARRAALLREACAGDEALFDEVWGLLEVHDALEFTGPPQAGDDVVEASLGPYRITRLLGVGGMGRVYLAVRTDGAFERRVAIKLIDPRRSDPHLIARFQQERRILAALQHPSIAALLDAGQTPDGRLYFVMEYVDGLPITAHAERHDLSISARLRLFLQVCEAVIAAHRALIVHRDLKPGNILVDPFGAPKLLDFGIAKPLTTAGLEASDPTEPGQQRLTPAYASPEQLHGGASHTGMDVFALGVILHELLTGLRPMALAGEQRTTTAPFVKPSDVVEGMAAPPGGPQPPGFAAALRGDLDAIVLKALQPSPRLRYRSVEALAADIRRHLEHRPVEAGGGGRLYRTGKFVRRHRAATAATLTATLALLVALGSLAVQYRQARAEQVRAEARFEAARSLSAALLAVDRTLGEGGSPTLVRQQIVASLGEYLETLQEQLPADASFDLELAEGYRRLGDVQGNPHQPNLGAHGAALASYATAIELAERARSRGHGGPALVLTIAGAHAGAGDVYASTGAGAEAMREYDATLEAVRDLAGAQPPDARALRVAAGIYRPQGDLALADGDGARALALYEQAMALERRVAAISGADRESQRLIALTHLRIAAAHAAMGRVGEAASGYGEAVAALQNLSGAAGSRRQLLREVAVGLL
jgi:eukaryotic-like serine/threonine-protein kinase